MIKIKRLIKSFKYAIKGLIKIFEEEQNLKVQSLIGFSAVFLAIFFRISRLEWIVLILIIGLVILMEIINSAVERVADILKPRIDTYVKEIKDITASAVMLASIISIIIGGIIFWPYIFN